MKETTKMSRVTGILEKMFRAFNDEIFGGEIPEPIITVQSTKGAYGHVTVREIWEVKESARRELNICADYLKRPIENLCATMVHEMVHLANLNNNIQDCSRGGTYHNTKFRDRANATGLIEVSHNQTYGWTVTEPTEKMIDFILEHDWKEILIGRNVNAGGSGTPTGGKTGNGETPAGTKKPNNSHLLICPCCGLKVRATKPNVRIICADCNENMIEK